MIDDPGVAKVWDAVPEARVVGGAVRDALAGLLPVDVDFASPLSPNEVMARLRDAGIKAVPTGLAHGTVTAVIEGRGFELTTLRRDVETDGRHARVAFTDDWREDAIRRDFTINAMSATRDGVVFDYFGGRADLAAKRVRFVGEPAARIAEDYLRILRFFRFYARFAEGEPDAPAVAAIHALRGGIAQLSAERVWSEIKRILAAKDPRRAVALMRETGVLELVMPADVRRLQALVERGAPVDPLLRVAALLDGDLEVFGAAMKLSGAELERLLALRMPGKLTPEAEDAEIRRALAMEPPAMLVDRSWLEQDGKPGWAALRERILATARPVFPLHGRDILARGVPPGPRVGEILGQVRTWWMAGGCVAGVQACLDRVSLTTSP